MDFMIYYIFLRWEIDSRSKRDSTNESNEVFIKRCEACRKKMKRGEVAIVTDHGRPDVSDVSTM